MIDRVTLLADLKKQVAALEDDLLVRAVEETDFDIALRREWRLAHERSRIAAPYDVWLDGQVTQAAVAWVLGTVFLRFCEDNRLIDLPYLAGPGERLAIATERQQAFFEQHPELTDRDWIIAGFTDLSKASPVAAGLFDRSHNPMWQITPSHPAAKELLAFWRRRGEGADAEIVHNFFDPDWNTRFLGDLYQDLSEHAKKTFALLQTPEFVEEFILNLTLDPAIDEFGLDPEPPEACPQELNLPRGLRVIDPTCGSGHFLLGAFHRILAKWEQQAPGADRWDLINRTLYSVHGVDKNPFAVAIARFRLLIAAMQAGGVKRLADTPAFTLNIAVGDSLLHGRDAPGIQEYLDASSGVFAYATEDINDYVKAVDILGAGSYQAVFGNPPYITVKDKQENENYRRGYGSCHREYSLSVPFAERIFHLAVAGYTSGENAGFTGQITANSFTKREFGKKLVEEYFAHKVQLTHVIDTSGVYIPEHGTPTIILGGRRRWPRNATVRAVRSVNGEPYPPKDPSKGFVWSAIVAQIHHTDSESPWVVVQDLDRTRYFRYHPWILEAGGLELVERIESSKASRLHDLAEVGANSVTRENEVFAVGDGVLRRWGVNESMRRPLVEGERVRDWSLSAESYGLWPYETNSLEPAIDSRGERWLWPWRAQLRRRVAFGKTQIERGLPWFSYSMFFKRRYSSPKLAYAEVQTHNQFILDQDDRVFLHSAPVVKLRDTVSGLGYIELLGLLNSSTACFWLKQFCYDKGTQGVNEGFKSQPWERFYQFNGTNVGKMPLPVQIPTEASGELNELAIRLKELDPARLMQAERPMSETLKKAGAEYATVRGKLIALQEELDWQVYWLYGLLSKQEYLELCSDTEILPEIKLGERAFEIVLAKKIDRGEAQKDWFDRHGAEPITEIPAHWPEAYRRVIEKRIKIIENRIDLALIERPECKRRWQVEPWENRKRAALRSWLLDRCEDRDLWFAPDDSGKLQPRPMTISRLADRLRDDTDFVSMVRLYAGSDAELSNTLAEILDSEHVPYLAALRYKHTGLRKRAQWEETWALQRQEDETKKRLKIDIPPKYTSKDFLKSSYWANRGKLDVPKERFISYPLASPDGDESMLLGWAGWDHREQAHALMTLIDDRSTRAGWGTDRLTPLIAGLAEVMPWVKQWHGEIDPAFGISPAGAFASFLEDQQIKHGLTDDDLTD